MNVLSGGVVPKVMNLREVLREWLDHRRDVLIRRSQHRLANIEKRLEVLSGFLVAYLNIDEVIRIVRFEDEPKKELIKAFDLTEVQADAILNLRLRALNKLEEVEIRKEFDQLSEEKDQIEKLLASEAAQWKDSRLGDRQCEGQVRQGHRAGPSPHHLCRGAGHRSGSRPAGDDRGRNR